MATRPLTEEELNRLRLRMVGLGSLDQAARSFEVSASCLKAALGGFRVMEKTRESLLGPRWRSRMRRKRVVLGLVLHGTPGVVQGPLDAVRADLDKDEMALARASGKKRRRK